MWDFDACAEYFIEFFEEKEKLFASRIFSLVSDTVNQTQKIDSDNFTIDDEECFTESIEATKENFEKIVQLFRECDKSRKAFRKTFPKWSGLRLENIKQLKDLGSNINTDRHNCNISNTVASVTGILGGAAIVSALVFPPAALLLGIAGGVTTGLSGATVVGTSITETALLKKCLDKAQEVKEKDIEEFKLVSGWFKHSQELIDLLAKILGFDLAKFLLDSLKSLNVDLKNLANLKNDELDRKLQFLIKLCVDKLMAAGIYRSIVEFVVLIPAVVTFFFVVVLLKKHNNLIFGCIVASHRIVFGLMKTLDLTADVGVMLSRVALKAATGVSGEVVTKATARVVATGAFATLGIALDVVNLVFASIDIHNGSISPYATQLLVLSNELDKEHKVIKSVYDALEA